MGERQKQIKKQFEARDIIEDLFLTRKIVIDFNDEKERDRLNAARMQEAEQQHEQIAQILEPCGSWDAGAIIHLIERLQGKAENMIADLRILNSVIKPEELRKYGFNENDINTVTAVHNKIREINEQAHKLQNAENARKGGEQRTQEQQKKYDEHLYWWKQWLLMPSLYQGITKYYKAMEDKTGITERALREQVREFEGDLELKRPNKNKSQKRK